MGGRFRRWIVGVISLLLMVQAATAASPGFSAVETDWLIQAMTRAQGAAGQAKGPAKPAAQDWPSLAAAAAAFTGPFPTEDVLARGRNLLADLRAAGADVARFEGELNAAAARTQALAPTAPANERRQAYFAARRAVRAAALANPLLDFNRLLFVKRFTQDTYPDVCLNHMPWVSKPGGDLCVLTSLEPDGKVRPLLNGALGPGHVHGMDLEWDAARVVFGYAKTKTPEGPKDRGRPANFLLRKTEEPTHLFEMNVDGSGLHQVTNHRQWSDLDPTYLPDGRIAFVSERCGTSLQCNEYDKDETSCNLYACGPDGKDLRWLSVSKDGDYLPHCLDNGLIVYTRWEYHERGWANIQSLWTLRPDGTGADALFKQHFNNPWAIYDARSIPRSAKLVAVAGGHHTLYAGPVIVVDPSLGINRPAGLAIVTPGCRPQEGGMSGTPVPQGGVPDAGGLYMTPWALSEKYFLAAYSYATLPMGKSDVTGYALYLIDVFGTKELVYRDPAISCFSPIPLRPRPRPPVLPDLTDPAKNYAECTVQDAAFGVEGVAPERVKYLRIAEPVAWPYDAVTGGHRYGEKGKTLNNWTPVRILGTVPVERDGSVHFQVPAATAVYFQLLDENQMELRRMRSFISFQRGETRGCVGCHETRETALTAPAGALALTRPPQPPAPPPWGADRAVSFLRDVQPIFDKHCVACHSGLKPAGGLDFGGGLTSYNPQVPGYGHNRAYDTLIDKKLVSCSAVHQQGAEITPPLAYGSLNSKIMKVLDAEMLRQSARLSDDERLRLVTWIDANAPYHDGFVNKRLPATPYDVAADQELLKTITAVHERRCAACHAAKDVSRLDWVDLRDPKRSLYLAAPLAAAAGGTGKCRGAPYKNAADADYAALLARTAAAVAAAWDRPRRDLLTLSRPAAGDAPPQATRSEETVGARAP